MVRFQARWMKKQYKKNKEYRYKYHFVGFPAGLNSEIEPRVKIDFELETGQQTTPKRKRLSESRSQGTSERPLQKRS